MGFQKATKKQLKLRMAIDGPAGSGKTFTALRFAFALASSPDKIAVLDTEARSASKYVGESPDDFRWEFDTQELNTFHPQHYINAIKEAEQAGYEVLIIDSLSHAWEGAEGILDLHDQATRRQRSHNSYTAWRDVTPIHNRLVETILQSKLHVIATMRAKMAYAQVEENGKTTVKKLGLAPVQRQGMEYEFDVVIDMDQDHYGMVSKTRCNAVDGKVELKPGPEFLKPVISWLNEGIREEPRAAAAPEAPPHWTEDADQKTVFTEQISALGLKAPDVLLALGGVHKVSDFPGTLMEAIEALQAYAAQKEAV